MIARIPRRLSFARFEGVRPTREGVVALRVVLDPQADAVHVAFATPRRIGSAVQRNRVRRQLRELMRARSAHLPTGWYLIGINAVPVDNSWGQLGTSLDRALLRVATPLSQQSTARPTIPTSAASL